MVRVTLLATSVLSVTVLLLAAPRLVEGRGGVLSVSLECSACEVTAREIFYGYVNRSRNEKFAGTELETIEVMETACKRLSKYLVAQENFGAHVKVFADPTVSYDLYNVQAPEFYSKAEQDRHNSASTHLVLRCQELCGRFEDEISELIHKRAPEAELRRYMCLEATKVCEEDKLKRYREFEKERRRKHKQKSEVKKYEEKWAKELNPDDL